MGDATKHKPGSAEQLLDFIRENLISDPDDSRGRAVQIDYFTRQGGVANIKVSEAKTVVLSKK